MAEIPHRGAVTAALIALLATVALAAGPVDAKRLGGGKRADVLVGGKRADKINGRGGPDRLNGRGGRDRLRGGPGRDRLRGGAGADRVIGGKGPDRHLGGRGRDRINAADGRRDRVINGGPGVDTCRIDTTRELSLVRGCERVLGSASDGPATAGGLRVISATGLSCGTALPLCVFNISGDGAEPLVGLVTGGPGVTISVGAGVSVTAPEWTALGLYGCNEDSYLRVTIGAKQVDVPIDCTA
jgi:hypothetical protein